MTKLTHGAWPTPAAELTVDLDVFASLNSLLTSERHINPPTGPRRHVHNVRASKHLHEGGGLLDGVATEQNPHANHGRTRDVVGNVDRKASGLGVGNVETAGIETMQDLLFVVDMEKVIASELFVWHVWMMSACVCECV